jgi:hypothetical protein
MGYAYGIEYRITIHCHRLKSKATGTTFPIPGLKSRATGSVMPMALNTATGEVPSARLVL